MFGIHISLLVRHWFKTFPLRLKGRCLSRKIYLFFLKHPILLLFLSELLPSITIACLRYLYSGTSYISVMTICLLSVVSIFVINGGSPLCILRQIYKFSSSTVFKWCSKSFAFSVAWATSSRNLRVTVFRHLYLFLSLPGRHSQRSPALLLWIFRGKSGSPASHLLVLVFVLRFDYPYVLLQ